MKTQLAVFRHLFASVTEEMGEALRHSAVSPNIKERCDFSCALIDERGRLISHAAHIPVHFGSAHLTVPAILRKLKPSPGDIFVLNDPHKGGTHLNDITVVSPLFRGKRLMGYLLNRAHHNDVGGVEPGSLTGAKTLKEEGVIIAPTYLQKSGVKVAETWELFEEKMREPSARRADLEAQCAALHRGGIRFEDLVERYGAAELKSAMSSLFCHGAKLTRAMLRTWPEKEVSVRDSLDGKGTPQIQLKLKKLGSRLTFDFSGTSLQVVGSWNTHRAVVLSAVVWALQTVSEQELSESGGILEPISLKLPIRSLLNSRPPGGVAVGNTETSQRVADMLIAALGKLLGKKIPAASQGTMNNLCFGGKRLDGTEFVYYETIGGGVGAGPTCNGASALQVQMTNTLNTPTEILEAELPLRVKEHSLRIGSGGKGQNKGGDGIIKEFEFLVPVRLGVIATRRFSSPIGRAGGKKGKPGRDRVRINGRWRNIAPGEMVNLQAGDCVQIQTPGGGGWGRSQ
ncbi:MAG: hydantoinase B/oxoprolinase family protein [Planctomycetota bacterium]|nr:hydantoinase B/oxoprolinase family protein [Planctomycetota bacterium]